MDFEAIWSFLTDKSNRDTLAWLGAPGGIAGQGTQIHGAVRIVNSKTGSLWPLLIFALFAAFALKVAVDGGRSAGNRAQACVPGVLLSQDPRLAADTLNARGVRAGQAGDYTRAAACFEAALDFDALNGGYALNLVRALSRGPAADIETALEVPEQLAQRQLRAMAEFRKDTRPTLQGLSCAERSRITGEAFGRDIWMERKRLFLMTEDWAGAVADLSRPIEAYPQDSCAWAAAVGDLLLARGLSQCVDGRPEGAVADVLHPLAMDDLPPEIARLYQERMARAGAYGGPIDGVFGGASQAAFRVWAAAGCPGLAEDLAARLSDA